MSEPHEGSGTVVVVAPGEAPSLEGEGNGAVEGGGEVEAVAKVSKAAVEIARLETERDVRVAEIQADAEGARMDAVLELDQNTELEQCRTRIAELEASNTSLLAEMATLRQLIPPPSAEPLPNPPLSDEADGQKENPAEVETEAPEPPAKVRKAVTWI